MLLTSGSSDIELDTVLSVVTWVFNRVTGYITLCNEHHSLWLPVGFAIAGMTVVLFRTAVGLGNKNSNF